jgi:hypothetical protein
VKKSPTDRETKKQRDRGTKTGIQWQRDIDRKTETQRVRDRDRNTVTETGRQKQREWETETGIQCQRQEDSNRESERQRQEERNRERERLRQENRNRERQRQEVRSRESKRQRQEDRNRESERQRQEDRKRESERAFVCIPYISSAPERTVEKSIAPSTPAPPDHNSFLLKISSCFLPLRDERGGEAMPTADRNQVSAVLRIWTNPPSQYETEETKPYREIKQQNNKPDFYGWIRVSQLTSEYG